MTFQHSSLIRILQNDSYTEMIEFISAKRKVSVCKSLMCGMVKNLIVLNINKFKDFIQLLCHGYFLAFYLSLTTI